jgi:hypothetical protein
MQDRSWGLTFMIFATTTFKHVIAADTAWESNFYREPFLAVLVPETIGLLSQLVVISFWWEWNIEFISRVCHQWWSRFLLLHWSDISIFIRCVTSAPNGSSPRGYSQIFYSSIGSKFSFFFNLVVQSVEYILSFPLNFCIHFLCELTVHRVRV